VPSQLRIANDQAESLVDRSPKEDISFRFSLLAEPATLTEPLSADRTSTSGAADPEVLAYGVEFVALPGTTEKLRMVIPEAIRRELANSGAFCGCMVLLSEQEARLVTVVTFWTGSDRAKHCSENSKRVDSLLLPYVDGWLRTRRMAALVCLPRHFWPR
jgi:hypothetical protein